jgi:hypothetical protein
MNESEVNERETFTQLWIVIQTHFIGRYRTKDIPKRGVSVKKKNKKKVLIMISQRTVKLYGLVTGRVSLPCSHLWDIRVYGSSSAIWGDLREIPGNS